MYKQKFESHLKNDSTLCEDFYAVDAYEFVDFSSVYGFVSQEQEKLAKNESRASIHITSRRA